MHIVTRLPDDGKEREKSEDECMRRHVQHSWFFCPFLKVDDDFLILIRIDAYTARCTPCGEERTADGGKLTAPCMQFAYKK